MARKWNYETNEYEEYELPKGASLYERNLNLIIMCAGCEKLVRLGDCYTSRTIHNETWFGYGVCGECYDKEFKEELKIKGERILGRKQNENI